MANKDRPQSRLDAVSEVAQRQNLSMNQPSAYVPKYIVPKAPALMTDEQMAQSRTPYADAARNADSVIAQVDKEQADSLENTVSQGQKEGVALKNAVVPPAAPSTSLDATIPDWRQQLADRIAENQALYEQAVADDTARTRSDAIKQKVAAVTDGLASIANAWGVKRNANNQIQPPAYNMVRQGVMEEQAIRQRNIEQLRRRLDEGFQNLGSMSLRDMSNNLRARDLDYKEDKEDRLRTQGEARAANSQYNAETARMKAEESARQFNEKQEMEQIKEDGRNARNTENNNTRMAIANAQQAGQNYRTEAQIAAKANGQSNSKIISSMASDANIENTRSNLLMDKFGTTNYTDLPNDPKVRQEFRRIQGAKSTEMKKILTEMVDSGELQLDGGQSAPAPVASSAPASSGAKTPPSQRKQTASSAKTPPSQRKENKKVPPSQR